MTPCPLLTSRRVPSPGPCSDDLRQKRIALCNDPMLEAFFAEISTHEEQGVSGNKSYVFYTALHYDFNHFPRGRYYYIRYLRVGNKYIKTVREYFVRSTTGREKWPRTKVGNKMVHEKRVGLGLDCGTPQPQPMAGSTSTC